ncbi:MAG: DUF4466 family protein [Chitinophaga sp.]|uniref:DUF4466 family protein n=1 Tax=Chitinophaga sp. TaxID=1869181 RepID=UPI0025C443D3|nr:DUF4466 family protein [Chitinophaga sp.]MBV8251265.1 DUF4466 family protein [Chitinophaga sp.]
MTINFKSYIPFFAGIVLLFAACSKNDDYAVPTPKNQLQNDCIKRSLGPNVVGGYIEFAYAMAIPKAKGKLVSAQVEASIPGGAGTYLENRSFYTNSSGVDVPVKIGDPSVTNGNVTTTNFTVDTNAATLRFFYQAPDAARGKQVSFTFTAKSSNGETVTYKMGPYSVSKMDMALDLGVTDADSSYISIADMKVYRRSQPVDPAKIDLIYMYRTFTTVTYKHALVAPAAPKDYLTDFVVPAGATNDVRLVKAFNLRDQQLARLPYGIFIDDPDFLAQDFTNTPDYFLNIKQEAGAWIETADGKYRAYIYFNVVDDTKKRMTISIKRYTMK